ncbi:MAG TPA: hypothetical protein PK683_22270, partial [Leptospiraceae bacterium]|nr:hypothetical protein [Leptospiraceae bacterium]
CKIENHSSRNDSALVKKLLVDTGSEYSWIFESTLNSIGVSIEKKDVPFKMANGTLITREIGFVIFRYDKYFTIDEVVFAKKGDLQLLGARTLEGLNLLVDTQKKKLVAAGPSVAA